MVQWPINLDNDQRIIGSILFLKKGPTAASFSFIFGLFKQTSIQFLQQFNVKKCHVHPVYGAGIRTHDHSIHLP